MDTNTALSQLGLDETESRLYATLLSSGTTPIMRLAKELNLPRTTIYRLCQKLVDQKFLEWVVTRQGKQIKAIDPARLHHLVKDQELKLKTTQEALTSLVLFQRTLKASLPQTQVRYYHGKEGMKQLVWNTLEAKQGIIGYSGFARNDVTGQLFENQYAEERNPRRITDTVIINKVNPGLQYSLDHHPKQLKYSRFYLLDKPDFTITGDTYIYNDIYAVNFWNETEIIGVEIQNQELVNLQTAIFNQLLPLCRPLP